MTPNFMLVKSDARQIPLADKSVHCVVTSIPYYGLRDYGTGRWEGGDTGCDHQSPNGQGETGQRSDRTFTANKPYGDICGKCGAVRIDKQIGLEQTPKEYIREMVRVFREVRRVLRDDGTVWLNVGDSYSQGGRGGGADGSKQRTNVGSLLGPKAHGSKPKELLGMPWRLALALQRDGWYLRRDIIWAKSNPMPESVTDRPITAHEYIFLLTKKPRYFYDHVAVRQTAVVRPHAHQARGDQGEHGVIHNGQYDAKDQKRVWAEDGGANLRSWWLINPQPFPGAHFATFPPQLVETCVKAGTSAYGCCPKCGAPYKRIVERERVATRPGTKSKVKVPNGWDTSKGEGGHGSFHKDGRGATEYRATDRTNGEQVECPQKPWAPQKSVSPVHHAIEVGNRDPQRHTTVMETKGWTPTCAHTVEDHELVPAVVLDPFIGSGTTALVANGLGRHGIGCDLNPEYLKMATERITRPHKPARRKDMPLPLFDDSPLAKDADMA